MGSSFLSPPAKKRSISYAAATGLVDPNPYSPNGSSKRSKSKPPPPPLSIPPGHVAFRLLCHESRIGGVIGKSGAVIKRLQQATGAKIRVEDAPPETPDRVILIVGAGAVASGNNKVSWRNPELENGEGARDCEAFEMSKAQEALLKVFERVLDVAAETEGIEIWDRVVSCRLLADTAQVGSVIGKGGKVVESIRKETGCKIRVSIDNLPACTTSSDEMIEIEGSVSSVKKALLAVSHRLQICPPADRTKMMGSKPYEVVPHENFVAVPYETLTDLHVDRLLQRSSALSTLSSSSNSYASGVHSLSAEINRGSALDSKTLQQEVSFKFICAIDRVGGVIGKGGSIVRALQNETGATISIGPSVADCEDRLITVTALENPESRYSPAQKAVVLVHSRSVEAGIEKGLDSGLNKGSSVTARLAVPSNQVGCLLGKGGAIVSEMRKTTGASIRIIGTDQVPKCASDNDQVVQISGGFSNVQDALYNATGRLRDNIFISAQNSAGTRSLSSVLADTSPYRRLRDAVPLGGQPAVGVPHSLSRSTLSQSIDHLALSRNLDRPSSPGLWTPSTVAGINSRGIDSLALSRNLDIPSSPELWAPPTVAGINSRGINDVSRGLSSLRGGLELVSGSKTAVVTNTTVEIVVPDDIIGSVYGENGSNLARLRQISGAKVIVREPRPGTSDRTIVISGTPDETQAAQSLLQAFILAGSS